ncbi:MAG: HAMP domain-containing sensor histidine kinase [Planctomycetota bacterium]|nr:HAMP domain-containing sensor histidine kinase [Planctomycetota bacterium]
MSIRKRLIRLSMVLSTLVVIITALGFWAAMRATFQTQLFLDLIADAGRLALMVVRGEPGDASPYSLDLRPSLFEGRYAPPDADAYFQVWASDGSTIAKSSSLIDADLPRPALTDQRTAAWASRATDKGPDDRLRFENQDLEVAPVRLPSGKDGYMCWIRWNPLRGPILQGPAVPDEFVVVAVARDPARYEAQERTVTIIIVCSAALALLIFRVLIGIIVARGLQPLRLLARQVERIDADRGGRVSETGMAQETTPIARALNGMLVKIEETLERERRFNENAAHELRTPLAEIRATADVARRLQGRESIELAVADISQSAAQMDAVLAALLRISRRRMEGELRPPSPVEIDAIVNRALARHTERLSTRGITLRGVVPNSISIMSDPAAIATIVSNLIDNAAQYTPDGGDILVELTRQDAAVRLFVRNGPVDLSSTEVQQMFEPFWRKDPTRGEGDHSGLGLAIVKAMCDGLDASVGASLNQQRQLTLAVSLPLARGAG